MVWLGWAIFYGSTALAIGLLLVVGGQSLLLRREEHDLEQQFGAASALAVAQPKYPARTVEVVVPYAPGGPIDVWGRILAQELTKAFGQSVVLDNRPGENGIVGTDILAKSPPDGYTLMYQTGSHVANVSMYRKLPYDSVRDFQPITQMATTHGMVLVVHPSVPATTVPGIEWRRRSRHASG